MRLPTPIVIILVLAGLAYRLWPTIAGQPALSQFFVTEDGYMILTVARNMAIGLGMSVSDGTIATNGVQPLMTFLDTLSYLATGGDKIGGLIGVHLIEAAITLAGFFAVRPLAARILAPRDAHPGWPWAVAMLWFLGPHLLRHTMNGLETGLITLVALWTLLQFARVLDAGSETSMAARMGLGALCGLAVLARNDAVFLVTGIFVVWAIWELFVQRAGVAAMLVRLIPPGLLSIAVAAPWLIYNRVYFGSIVPISGRSEALEVPFGENLPRMSAQIFENFFPMLPIPGRLETQPAVMALAGGAVVVVLALFSWRVLRHCSASARAMVTAFGIYAIAICGYYGLWFGAGYFLSRYLAPLAPLFIVASLIAALETGRFLLRNAPALLAQAYVVVGLALSVALLGQKLLPGAIVQGHSQVIAWVEANVPEEAWVGAPQTGTLGYWHDRTINLDGKLNPAALIARRDRGHVLDYVVESDIDYIVDWAGMEGWLDMPQAQGGFAQAFELVLVDKKANLSVMRRRDLRYQGPATPDQ